MGFSKGDRVRVTMVDSTNTGRTGRVIHVNRVSEFYVVRFGGSSEVSSYFASELEPFDPWHEELVELAETLNKVRLQAKPAEPHAGLQVIYNEIGVAFYDTLRMLIVEFDDVNKAYDHILDGGTVREALALVAEEEE